MHPRRGAIRFGRDHCTAQMGQTACADQAHHQQTVGRQACAQMEKGTRKIVDGGQSAKIGDEVERAAIEGPFLVEREWIDAHDISGDGEIVR